jgi:tRNA-Thr(GGU) m(6)t(6)A37 methyltransferase TsaA
MDYTFQPIGVISSPYKEKFGIPRQSSLVPAARSQLVLLPPFDHPDTVRGLEAFSHIWIQFVFHQTAERGWSPLVRPPRLGGNTKVGVFASRSTHRPNPIGLSLVELRNIDYSNGVILELRGADLMDGTPVLDIKPYIAFVEAQPEARSGFVDGPPQTLAVAWSQRARQQLDLLPAPPDNLEELISQMISQDPRPAYQNDPDRRYGVRLFDYDIRFKIANQAAEICEIIMLEQN